MNIKTLLVVLLLFISTQLKAQLIFDFGLQGGKGQSFSTLSLGYQFQNALTVRAKYSNGYFGEETRMTSDPYVDVQLPYTAVTEFEFSSISKYTSSNAGLGVGLAIGYNFLLNDKHSIHGEAMAQFYFVKDAIELEYISTFGPNKGAIWSRVEEHRHNNWSAGLGIRHQIRFRKWGAFYYGFQANYFVPILKNGAGDLNGYNPKRGEAMYGLKPTLQLGIQLYLVEFRDAAQKILKRKSPEPASDL